jgi:hypothetical protein
MAETEVIEEVEESPEPVDEGNGPKELRAALKRTNEENAELRGLLMKDAWTAIDLDPERGLGKAIAKEYKGQPTASALAEYAATEYGHNVPDAPENPAEPVITDATAQAEAIRNVTQPVVPDAPEEARRKAEAERDWDTAGNIKANKLRRMMTPGTRA